MNERIQPLIRVFAISKNTFIEAMRARTLHVLFLFGIVMVSASNFFSEFAIIEQFKFLKDTGYAAISLTGLLIAMIGASQLIPAEVERRTIFTVMSKPIHRFEFILGKYLGILTLILLVTTIMSLIFGAILLFKEAELSAPYLVNGQPVGDAAIQAVQDIRQQARDPRLIQAILLILGKLAVVAAIAVLISTIATSTIFIVSTTIVIYLVGHIHPIAREAWLSQGDMSWIQSAFLNATAWLVPDFLNYSIIDDILAGATIPWAQTADILGYSAAYIIALLCASSIIFEGREL